MFRLRAQLESRKEAEKRILAVMLRLTVGFLAIASVVSIALIGPAYASKVDFAFILRRKFAH